MEKTLPDELGAVEQKRKLVHPGYTQTCSFLVLSVFNPLNRDRERQKLEGHSVEHQDPCIILWEIN